MQKKQAFLPAGLKKIKKELKNRSRNAHIKSDLSLQERCLLEDINKRTSLLNKNNITRTKAYLDFYQSRPEIHWAFLGHMVSRNGGWNMTDLKGSFLSKLLNQNEVEVFFDFLERGNWLIFQDVFPQFLLYEESLRHGKSYFHLLPHLNISIFMETIWNQFLNDSDSHILTLALIVNEQSYLEERVISDAVYQKKVMNTLEFKLQDYLSMNHIIFPFQEKEKITFVGQTLHHFESLHERILMGRRLYNVLFGQKERLKLIIKWAENHPHTGSRKDYWPHLFNDVNEGPPSLSLKPSIRSCYLVPGADKIFSPRLEYAWKDKWHAPAEKGDWFKDWKVIYYLNKIEEKVDGEIQYDYCKTLERLELAAITKKVISLRDE